jgi:hypothetical protein
MFHFAGLTLNECDTLVIHCGTVNLIQVDVCVLQPFFYVISCFPIWIVNTKNTKRCRNEYGIVILRDVAKKPIIESEVGVRVTT